MDNTSQAQQTDIENVLYFSTVFTTTAAKSSFLSKLVIFNDEILSRNQCSILVTDGYGAIPGVRRGFHARAKNIYPKVKMYSCSVHRENLLGGCRKICVL